NMHVPAGLLVNLAIWHQQPHWPSFITGAAVILASLWVHRKWVMYADVSQGSVRYNIATKADIAIIATAANGSKMTKNYRANYSI
ncbi:YajG family lipoprotein, partial [Salmonella enterica subsp. enterica serovar Kentucky]|nr:YajG family lipoprotein [Salmonella enterica subsp. enterica serovar Kentucky]